MIRHSPPPRTPATRLGPMTAALLATLPCLAGCPAQEADDDTMGDNDTTAGDDDTTAGDDDTSAGDDDTSPTMETVTVMDRQRISGNAYQDEYPFQNAYADVDLGDGPFTEVRMITDLETSCYPFEDWEDPPAGQNWPATCDAYDRNYQFSFDPPEVEGDPPELEVLRAITPFGGPLHIEKDLTDFWNGLPGTHRLHVTIPSWIDGSGQVSGSDGGWWVTVSFEVTRGAAPREVLAVVPLVYEWLGSDTVPADRALPVPEGTTSTRLEYRVTGHGGGNDTSLACIGPAEEFCKRHHHVSVDGTEVEDLVPWRDDCDALCTVAHYDAWGFDYCLENPCGAMSSVRAPRANWCPGSVTPPFLWEDLPALVPGDHTFRYSIDDIHSGGGWMVSAVFYAFGA